MVTTDDDRQQRKAMEDWLAAHEVIKQFLRELAPGFTPEQLDHNAAALIARLAQKGMVVGR